MSDAAAVELNIEAAYYLLDQNHIEAAAICFQRAKEIISPKIYKQCCNCGSYYGQWCLKRKIPVQPGSQRAETCSDYRNCRACHNPLVEKPSKEACAKCQKFIEERA